MRLNSRCASMSVGSHWRGSNARQDGPSRWSQEKGLPKAYAHAAAAPAHVRQPVFFLQRLDAAAPLVGRVLLAVAAELHQQEALARRHELDVGLFIPLGLDPLEQQMVDSLQGRRAEFQDVHEMRAGGID